uniref:Predicted protein n=1 Tax=Hordeum vulgare subsp. vulgare TaxID=112509 RepID=F2DIR7_HORVV|nr:predicted protein [Hordeum vulgare subsp. vulgare]
MGEDRRRAWQTMCGDLGRQRALNDVVSSWMQKTSTCAYARGILVPSDARKWEKRKKSIEKEEMAL